MPEQGIAVEDITAFCVRCKEKVVVSTSLEGFKPGVSQLERGNFVLKGWCPKCNCKVTRILAKASPLVGGYLKVVEGSTKKPKSKTPTKKKSRKPTKLVGPHIQGGKTVPRRKAVASTGEVLKVRADYPINLFAHYKGQTYRATMKSENEVRYNKVVYTSLTLAAQAITGSQVNGWKFWKFEHSDGTIFHIDVVRDRSEVQKRAKGSGEAKRGKAATKPGTLPPYSRDVEHPKEGLPKRGVAHFINEKKYERFGHVVTYLYLDGEVMRVTYNKVGKSTSVENIGAFDSWKEAIPTIVENAESGKLVRVRLVTV